MHTHVRKKGYFKENVPTYRRAIALFSTPFTAVCSIGIAYLISPSMGLNVWLLRHLFFVAGNALDKKFERV
jgi:type IV secretory pathway TrbD component